MPRLIHVSPFAPVIEGVKMGERVVLVPGFPEGDGHTGIDASACDRAQAEASFVQCVGRSQGKNGRL